MTPTIKRQLGFTLVELLIVISITAIVAAISIPFDRSIIQNMNLSAATRDLASDLRYAQQLAVTTQINYNVIIDIASNSYQIKDAATATTIKNVNIKNNIYLKSVSDFSSNTASFNATGAALSTGSIVLSNLSGRESIIEIKPSGYVKISQ